VGTPELISGVSDAVGLVGALLLAWPFVRGQQLQVLRDRIKRRPEDQTQERVQRMFETAEDDISTRLETFSTGDYRMGVLGSGLLALSFFVKIVALALGIYEP
jgi:hypothetical protein